MEEIVILTNIKIIEILMLIMIFDDNNNSQPPPNYIYIPYSQFQRNFDSVKIPVSLTNFFSFLFLFIMFCFGHVNA